MSFTDNSEIVLRFTPRAQWERALKDGFYVAEDFDKDGFIHCSTPEQVLRTANKYAPGKQDLVLLVIEVAKVQAPLVFESRKKGAELFPHIYGNLNLDAVIAARDFPPNADGTFSFPAEVQFLFKK
ncbi:MAG: DUF952 domain-containing protein [Bacteroidetes bacterium]|nr:MAG: DUF952 domain-containing protein [Bacteroidota bacterium]